MESTDACQHFGSMTKLGTGSTAKDLVLEAMKVREEPAAIV